MGTWAQTKKDREKALGSLRLGEKGFSYTYFFTNNHDGIHSSLVGPENQGIDRSVLHDLSRFFEDFVLCDRVGVSDAFYDMIGPHLIDSYVGALSEFPLFSVNDQL